jgi:hypothetical protein
VSRTERQSALASARDSHFVPSGQVRRRDQECRGDEASTFLARKTVSHARLAFILLDNAAEVIMRRNVEVRLAGNMLMERILASGKRSWTGSRQR